MLWRERAADYEEDMRLSEKTRSDFDALEAIIPFPKDRDFYSAIHFWLGSARSYGLFSLTEYERIVSEIRAHGQTVWF